MEDFDGLLKDYEQIKKYNLKLQQVIEQHHKWHQDIGIVKLIHEDGKETELDLSLEYSDSSLCDETMEALALNKTRGK